MTLDDARELLSLLGPLAVVIGVAIAVFQLRDLRRMRQTEIVMQLFDRFDDDSFQRRLQDLLRWDFRDLGDFERRAKPDHWVTLYAVTAYFENMGLLYKRRLAPIELLDDMLSGPITMSWQKVGPIWFGYRRKHHKPMFAEWFELLATDMERRLARLERRQPAREMLEDPARAARPSPDGAPSAHRARKRGNRWRRK